MIKKIILIIFSFVLILVISGCEKVNIQEEIRAQNPRNDVYYQIFVRSFADSNADGIGDFNGIIDKLDYLVDLGVTGLWLMPIHPSPTYHGYDVSDYYGVNQEYGTIDDFKNLITAAHEKGIKIILDMVFNHTSSDHPWFKKALEGDEIYRDYYVFADSTTNRSLTGSWGQDIWHSNDDDNYCGYFSHTMPDLNFLNENVLEEIMNISEFWINNGVDGFRLDAAHHFFGTNEYQDNSNSYYFYENIIFLQNLRNYTRELNPDFYLTGEINVDAESIVLEFFRAIDSPLDFPISSRLRQTIVSNGNSSYTTILNRVYGKYRDVNSSFISAPFILNHDQDRLASIVNGDINKMKLAAEMLLTLPGSPIIYYGEEVGMFGFKSNGDESNGVEIWDETRRLPIPFGDAYTTTWFNDEEFKSVIDNQGIPTVEEQLVDSNSLLNIYKNIIKVRNENIALKYGNSFEVYENNSYSIQGFYREFTYKDENQRVLVIHNLSKEDQEMIEYTGEIIYVSNTDDYTNIDTIKGKSTIIIDVTGANND